uniref:Lipoprotein n=1 Tax=Paracidobacterium acidisoli TaxID=2303751 RepID=A0A372IJY6_9BACT
MALLLVTVVAGLAGAGCGGGGSKSNTADNPGVAGGSSSAQYTTYIGTQSLQWDVSGIPNSTSFQYGGGWAIALDDSSKFFSYQNTEHEGAVIAGSPSHTPPLAATLGSFTGSSFYSLTANGSTTPGDAGYALEVPGEAVVLRPGNNTIAPAVGVETSNCLTLTKPTTYQFISLGTPDPDSTDGGGGPALGPYVAYGSVTAQTNGVTWNFTNLQMFAFDGTNLNATALPAGGCGETALGFAVTIAPSAATNNLNYSLQASPSGYFMVDQDQGAPTLFDFAPAQTGPLGLVGVEQPSSQLSTSAVAGAKYLGFEYDAIDDIVLGLPGTLPVAFGQTGASGASGSGTAITGGAYPNDDVTQTPAANITIDLGTQDSANNGLYKSVTVTVPDTYKACIQQPYGGTDANGNPTCIFKGEAVVGNPGGKYAIFVTVNDLSLQNYPDPRTGGHVTPYGAMDFFLYQQ